MCSSTFSRSRLIELLEYEGFSTRDALFAVGHLKVDWIEQAAKSAAERIEVNGFSRNELLDQLMYEGFNGEQAASVSIRWGCRPAPFCRSPGLGRSLG